eukprot:CAMPEP_0183716012 /NCGR_PEP_ID=MMETSP0737-20130205/10058_1 /TAXON_ID=385413 /ORGANISM="Thalassiosira miniscula, Strain CCMP1093" /LENGTH=49 /DNA_ID= /DNA_START= /DNA_END= /DNA_ORIENTATION=
MSYKTAIPIRTTIASLYSNVVRSLRSFVTEQSIESAPSGDAPMADKYSP